MTFRLTEVWQGNAFLSVLWLIAFLMLHPAALVICIVGLAVCGLSYLAFKR